MKPVIDIEFVAKQAYHDLAGYWAAIGQTPLDRWEATHPMMREMSLSSIQRHMTYQGELSPKLSHSLWFTEAYTRGWRYGKTFSIAPVDGHPRNPRMILWEEMDPIMQKVSDIVCHTFQTFLPELRTLYTPSPQTNGVAFSGGIRNMTIHNM